MYTQKSKTCTRNITLCLFFLLFFFLLICFITFFIYETPRNTPCNKCSPYSPPFFVSLVAELASPYGIIMSILIYRYFINCLFRELDHEYIHVVQNYFNEIPTPPPLPDPVDMLVDIRFNLSCTVNIQLS